MASLLGFRPIHVMGGTAAMTAPDNNYVMASEVDTYGDWVDVRGSFTQYLMFQDPWEEVRWWLRSLE